MDYFKTDFEKVLGLSTSYFLIYYKLINLPNTYLILNSI